MSRSVNPRPQYFDAAGDPLVAGKMYFFESGTDTPKTTYADVNLLIPNTHPVVLTGDGRLPNVFFQGTTRQKLTNSDDVQLWDVDNVSDDDVDVAFSNWTPLIIYNETDIVQGNDGRFYISITNGNEGNDPTTTPTEWQEIQFINVWNTNVTYQIGVTVKASDNLFYVSQTADNLGNDPTVDAVNWGPPFDGVVTVTGGTGITVTGTLSDPIVNADNNGTVTSVTGGTGITITGTANDPVVNSDNNGTVTSVATSGLATGGPITGTGTVDVPKADASDVATGTDDAKAVTPLAMADALLGANNLSDVADTQTSLSALIAGNFVNRIVGADIVSASPLVLGSDGDHFSVTGNTSFSVITVVADRYFTCTFTGTPTITVGGGITLNNAGANYTVEAGDTLVGQSTAANIVAGYIIKADGTALVAPVGADAVLLETIVASAQATVDLTAFDNATYTSYEGRIDGYVPATDATQLLVRTSTDGGLNFDAAAGDYGGYGQGYVEGVGFQGLNIPGGTATSIPLAFGATNIGNAAGEGMSGTVGIFAATVASLFTHIRGFIAGTTSNGTDAHFVVGGARTIAEDVDAIRFIPSSGNITSGTFELWGYK